MNPLTPMDPMVPNQASQHPTSKAPGPSIEAFEHFIDQMTAEKLSQPVTSPAAIAAQQSLEEFRHKLALLSGMLEQAQIAMNGSPHRPGSPSGQDEQNYFLLKSKLSQVGLPDGVNNIL